MPICFLSNTNGALTVNCATVHLLREDLNRPAQAEVLADRVTKNIAANESCRAALPVSFARIPSLRSLSPDSRSRKPCDLRIDKTRRRNLREMPNSPNVLAPKVVQQEMKIVAKALTLILSISGSRQNLEFESCSVSGKSEVKRIPLERDHRND